MRSALVAAALAVVLLGGTAWVGLRDWRHADPLVPDRHQRIAAADALLRNLAGDCRRCAVEWLGGDADGERVRVVGRRSAQCLRVDLGRLAADTRTGLRGAVPVTC
jgi:hypothetical protein